MLNNDQLVYTLLELTLSLPFHLRSLAPFLQSTAARAIYAT